MGFYLMFKTINLGNERFSLEILQRIKEKNNVSFDIRITNSHIKNLNVILGRNVFKKDTLFVSAKTLWEIMQPIGGKGKHHYHGLSPKDIYNTLTSLKYSKRIYFSYDNRYVILTLAVFEMAKLAIVVQPNCSLKDNATTNVIKIITIYPKS